jgi:hypothetical protein
MTKILLWTLVAAMFAPSVMAQQKPDAVTLAVSQLGAELAMARVGIAMQEKRANDAEARADADEKRIKELQDQIVRQPSPAAK